MVTLVLSKLGAASIVRTSQGMELTWLRLSAAASGMGIADHAPMTTSATAIPMSAQALRRGAIELMTKVFAINLAGLSLA
jgi:hypothetical protein